MRVFFVDPGRMCGYGMLQWGQNLNAPIFTGAELPYDDFLDWCGNPLYGLRTWLLDRVVCEGFDVTPRTHQATPNDATLWAVKGLGVLEMWCRWYGIPFERQSRTAKNFDKNGDKLKALGWWTATAPNEGGHRRDAGRHAIKWAVAHGVIDAGVFL